jgi:outer membrane protein assembly factor BamB
MTRRYLHALGALCLFSLVATAADWTQFRGPGGNASSQDTVPDKWSEKDNVLWKTKLPGLGTSSPITVGDAIFLTCYSGYAESAGDPGDQKDLMRHLVCLDRKAGALRWTKDVKPELPESAYRQGNDGTASAYQSS